MLNFDLQNHRPLRELVYEELKRQILRGKITPGTRMMEVELAEEMGVSRTPVREAIRKLEKEGLVRQRARAGHHDERMAREARVVGRVDVREGVFREARALVEIFAAARDFVNRRVYLENYFFAALREQRESRRAYAAPAKFRRGAEMLDVDEILRLPA